MGSDAAKDYGDDQDAGVRDNPATPVVTHHIAEAERAKIEAAKAEAKCLKNEEKRALKTRFDNEDTSSTALGGAAGSSHSGCVCPSSDGLGTSDSTAEAYSFQKNAKSVESVAVSGSAAPSDASPLASLFNNIITTGCMLGGAAGFSYSGCVCPSSDGLGASDSTAEAYSLKKSANVFESVAVSDTAAPSVMSPLVSLFINYNISTGRTLGGAAGSSCSGCVCPSPDGLGASDSTAEAYSILKSAKSVESVAVSGTAAPSDASSKPSSTSSSATTKFFGLPCDSSHASTSKSMR